ncbi:fimbrial protein [Stenotrophomonas sp. CC22-02]|uniref:fimbrial protein n=1 Tax=Stenotrophomonas sp. CC22-02 TaxID=1378087 RepID=UPI001062C6C9|nr:fimbrial protein [Stenotrophomonas sp. CC22-02]TDV29404.1 type 1 fimbria pilin [Stenotrophomonas sp. CC22-02]
MKPSHLIFAALLFGAAPLAHADTANITVTGKVLPGTCTMDDVTLTLDDIDATDLKAGHDNGLKPATLNFTGCVGVGSIDLKFDGTSDAAQDGHWKNLETTGGATGVAVALLKGPTGPNYFKNGDTENVAVNGAATAKLDMGVGYFRKTGTPLVAGAVRAEITVTADYK